MNLAEIVSTCPPPELSHGFNKGCTFNVTHRTTQFDDANIRLFIGVVHGRPGNLLDPVLDAVRDMRHDLHGLAQVVSFPLAFNDVLIYFSSRNAVFPCQGHVEVSLVIAQVQVYFTAIVQNKTFAVPAECLLDPSLFGMETGRKTYSVGAMVPASTLRYGSILIAVTCHEGQQASCIRVCG